MSTKNKTKRPGSWSLINFFFAIVLIVLVVFAGLTGVGKNLGYIFGSLTFVLTIGFWLVFYFYDKKYKLNHKFFLAWTICFFILSTIAGISEIVSAATAIVDEEGFWEPGLVAFIIAIAAQVVNLIVSIGLDYAIDRDKYGPTVIVIG